LFQELQKDGRVPFVALADKLGVSEAHVRKRVARLTGSGVFSITAIADPQVLGIDSMALVGLNVRGGQAAAVAETLVGMAGFDYVVQTAGGFNVLAEAACRSSSELYTLLRAVRGIPGVQRTETFVYLNLIRQQFQWSLDGARGGVQSEGACSFDALDIELIDELQRDGRAPFRRIARNLSVSERVVSTRVARLLDQNALQVIAVGNPATLGFEAMAWLGIKVNEGVRLEDAAELLSKVPGIDYVVIPAGRYDLMAELVCRDQAELLNALEHGIGDIPEIAHVETFVYLRLLYRSAIGAWGASRSLSAIPGKQA
jgi:Lrp/AsnC family transcriptional regulator for asnA, asnC and gidA